MPARLLFSLVGGLLLWIAQPGFDVWPAAPAGVALLAIATRGAGARRGALCGFAGGLAYLTPLLSWTGIYVGALPWLALSVLQALYLALLGALSARPSVPRRAYPWLVGAAWVTSEFLRSTTPYGGFPWARLAFGVLDSPVARVAALLGAPGVTFAVAVCGGYLAVAALRAWDRFGPAHPRSGAEGPDRPDDSTGTEGPGGHATTRGPGARRTVALLAPLAAAVAAALAPLLIPLPAPDEAQPRARIVAIQGSVPQAGLDFNAQRRAVLDNHARVTAQAAADLRAYGERAPDLVVWPENASDIDPLRNADAAGVIRDAVADIGAPTLVGAVLSEPVGHVTNAALLYEPSRAEPSQRYDKRHPVPFAEYIPQRSFWRLFSDKVDLVERDFVGGAAVGIIRVPRAGGEPTIAAGANICFEVAYDDLVRDGVTHGANLIVVQTNNATFGLTHESVQQLAISRLRAIEHGRSVVHISNVGVSSMITPDGVAHGWTALFEPAVLTADLPLRAEETLATRLGDWPAMLTTTGTIVLTIGMALAGARRRPRRMGGPDRSRAEDEMPAFARFRQAAPVTPDRVRPPLDKVVVLIPTYNERENLPIITRRIRESVPQCDVLVLEDNSPDGTGEVADGLAAEDPRIQVLHREVKEGLGKAYLAGFEWALERGYDAVVEIDADGSHRPEHLPALLAAAEDADVVIGSRWVPGGSVVNWPAHRKALSVYGNRYISVLLGMPVRDATAGFRVYRTDALRVMGLDQVESHGYCFQTDLTWKAVKAGLTIVEVPIMFVEREIGDSKMSGDIFRESLLNVTSWGVKYRAQQARNLVRRAAARRRKRQWKALDEMRDG